MEVSTAVQLLKMQ